jgi:hypothetical protein
VTRQYQGIFSAGGRAPSIRENSLGTRLIRKKTWKIKIWKKIKQIKIRKIRR